jgi:DNA-binding transcriptional regulator WhiA
MQWSDEEINILINEYGKVKAKILANRLGRTPSSIRWKAQELGLKADRLITNQRNELDHNFFETPNPLNCYIAGLIAADGSICTKRKNVWFFQKEKYLVEYIKNSIKASNSIYYRKRKNTEEYSILFTSSKIINDLKNNFGIIDNKSKIGLPIPSIQNKELIACYVAGLIDGDGSISYTLEPRNKKSYRFIFTLLCSKDCLYWINDSLDFSISISKRNDCKVDLYKMQASCTKALNFLSYIYDIIYNKNIQISSKWKKVGDYKCCFRSP